MEQTHDLTTRVQEAAQKLQGDLDQVRRELAELNVGIPQNSAEVDRLAQRELTISSRQREMDMNLDSYPRGDIRQHGEALLPACLHLTRFPRCATIGARWIWGGRPG